MKKLILIITLLLIPARVFALDNGSFEIKVTVNKAPGIKAFLPKDGFVITEGDTLKISVDASDPNDDVLQYRFYINGVIERPWSAERTFDYTLAGGDVGMNTIKAEVTDGMEVIGTEDAEIYVFREAPDLPVVE